MKTREDIIISMCLTYRHDFGLVPSGMTDQEKESLYRQMAQIFDNCIQPYMEFKP